MENGASAQHTHTHKHTIEKTACIVCLESHQPRLVTHVNGKKYIR